MRKFYIKFFTLSFLCLYTPFFADAYTFTKDLKIGDTNYGVIELQKILNSNSSTLVSSIGVGSVGNETNYFGNLTKQAIIRFQEKYRDEILIPNGLSLGTGFVGNSTRKKLNSLGNLSVNSETLTKSSILQSEVVKDEENNTFNEISTNENNRANKYFGSILSKIPTQSLFSLEKLVPKDALNLFPSYSNNVKVFQVEPYQVKAGQKVVVSGTGFMKENNIFSFGSYKTSSINCQYSTSCDVFVPENVSNGQMEVSLENSKGNSRNQGFSAKVLITSSPVSAPTVKLMSKNDLFASDLGAELTAKGEGFSASENYIYSPLGKVGPYNSSDGKLVSFSLKNMTDINKLIERGRILKTEIIPVPLRIGNENGTSDIIFINLYVNK